MAYYFDWHVISYLADPLALKGELLVDILCLQNTLEMADRERLVIPYSDWHLSDIKKGPPDQHDTWIDWVETISRGWRIFESSDDKEQVLFQRTADVRRHFQHYRDHSGVKASFDSPINRLIDSVVDITKTQTRLKFQEGDHAIPRKSVLYKQIDRILRNDHKADGLDIVRLNKTMRGELRRPSGKQVRFPEIPERKHKLFTASSEDFRAFLDDAVAQSDLPYGNFAELDNSVPNIPTGGFLSEFTASVNRLCTLANFVGVGSEKIKNSSPPERFAGMINDLGHLSLGLRCSGIVSVDGALLEKALFVKKLLNLDAQVFRPSDFTKKILLDYANFYSAQSSEQSGEHQQLFTFQFLAGDQKLCIRKYIVDVSAQTVVEGE